MSTSVTKRMISVYNQMAAPMRFFSGFFQSPAGNFHNSEEVEIDIIRSEEDISIAIQDLSTGYRMNSDDLYTNKGFKPPIHKEAIGLNSFDLVKRMPGSNPFEDNDFRSSLLVRFFNGMVKVEDKIRRSIELQASQVLQTGVVTLSDSAGTAVYTLDYAPKSTHFPTSGVDWDTATGENMMDDLGSLAEVIRSDGLADPDMLIFGVDAFEKFISNAEVQKRFDNRRMGLGMISPLEIRGNGGTYRGVLEIGNYSYEVWTYSGRYKHPQTGVITPFMDPAKVIVKASGGRMDATFGAIPNIGALLGAGSAAMLPELPGRVSNVEGGMDLFTNIWLSPDGEQLFGGVGARPLMIPTGIDTYGCLETQL